MAGRKETCLLRSVTRSAFENSDLEMILKIMLNTPNES